jgi:natural product biosynthesis luciferase-like monooxygenase protein
VVTREAAANIFEIAPGEEDTFAHMLFVTHVKAEYRDKLPATTHVDGSARAQTVNSKENPKLWQLLNLFGSETGIPVVLNTSFNVRGQPIVCSPTEAIDTFLKAGLDALVLGHLLLVPKKAREEAAIPDLDREKRRSRLQEIAARHEEFWVNRLASLEPISVPLRREELDGTPKPKTGRVAADVRRRTPGATDPDSAVDVSNCAGPEVLAAFLIWLARTTGNTSFDIGFTSDELIEQTRDISQEFAAVVPFHCEIEPRTTFLDVVADVESEISKLQDRGTYLLDVNSRNPALKRFGSDSQNFAVVIRFEKNPGTAPESVPGAEVTFVIADTFQNSSVRYDANLLREETVSSMASQVGALLADAKAGTAKPVSQLSLMSETERRQVLLEWNDTKRANVPNACVHHLFVQQALRTPDAIALAFQDQELTYAELDCRSSQVAAKLQSLGVGPDVLVAVCAKVSLEMMIGLLGVLKAGGAYVPLDPGYPADRIAFMLEDSKAPVLVTQDALIPKLPQTSAQVVSLDSLDFAQRNGHSPTAMPFEQSPASLAYLIYTSGSTGKPKGVMVTHGNVVNFFVGMDERVGPHPGGVWLSVTSISFDISVLELFWTLTRGFKVVLHSKDAIPAPHPSTNGAPRTKSVDFSLFYFAADESAAGAQKYKLLLEGAKFADRNGFAAVWTPERHFHAFGGLYPNPSVTSAAIAAITERVQIRAGSVVLPLHDPVRVAEEWALVDNISNGRVGISFASGWQVNDFVFAPANYARRKEVMLESIERVKKLWRGEPFEFDSPKSGKVKLSVLPRPVQSELPIWLTASGNPETFEQAGRLGANVLTHLLGQNLFELKQKIDVYRNARREAGHSGPGHVTLMLHTFVGESMEAVKETVRRPFTNYLRTSIDLIKNDPWAFSTFKPAASKNGNGNSTRKGKGNGQGQNWTDEERDAIAAHAFNRYFETSGLFGTPDHCAAQVQKIKALGVDEVACLIDFGVPEDLALAGLEQLNKVREMAAEPVNVPEPARYSVGREMKMHGVTHLQCTPSMASMLLEEPEAAQSVKNLRKLLLGGEGVPLALVQSIETVAEILNMYGPTETTIWSATDVIDESENRVTIGRPIANTQIHIVDKWLQPLPAGIPGELLIGGHGVVRGYLHRPELTAERFIPNPFDASGKSRLYRTGDLARYLPDGRVEFLGRLDHQVKLRGYRIELGEIETVLRRHAAVKECVAIVREDNPGDKRLVAYIVANAGNRVDSAALREHVKGALPEYMLPSAFAAMEALPLTPNGKVDRKALPAPSRERKTTQTDPNGPRLSQPQHGKATPSSVTEQNVSRAYAELLGVESVGLDDNFFELGGNSLLATQLITRLREAFKWKLPLQLAFENPTVQTLAKAISEAQSKPGAALQDTDQIEATERNGSLPLSFAQHRIWFLHQLEPGSHYNDHFDLRLTGPVDVAALERAINEIIRRHETLRSTFTKGDSGPVLQILPELTIKLDVTDISSLPVQAQEQQAIHIAVRDCRQPFDLENGPLFRASLVRLAPEDHLLVLTFDHIVIDGWSHGVFLSEMTALYEAFLAGKPSPLPQLAIQYTDFADWQQKWFKGENIEPHLAYWRKQLAGAPPVLELPADHPRPVVETFRGARHFLRFNKDLIDALSTVGRKENSTLFMVFLAAFQVLLSKYSDREDIILGSPIANRNRAETEALIGSFMNTLVLRGDLRGDPSFLEFLQRVRRVCLDAYAHQDLPFEQLVADIQPPRDLGYSPVFQVMFILQNTPMPVANAAGLSFAHFDVDAGSSKLDITLNLEETKEGAIGWIEYATDLFDPASMTAMAGHFDTLLRSIAADARKKLSQLRLVPEGQEWRFPVGSSTARSRSLPREIVTTDPISTPSLGSPALSAASPNAKPMTKVQTELGAIWSEVLDVGGIELTDNLFDLGGHSLLITRIISRIRKNFGVELPIHKFFENPTLGGVAAAIEAELSRPVTEKPKAAAIPRLARR